jgi:Na+-transporting methylmalonyl-CoA/oxaloacetate decarboxylase gamma subunit
VDEFLKHLILENKLVLTLLAMAFTPVGLWVAWRHLNRDSHPDPVAAPEGQETAAQLAAMERTLGALVAEVASLREQQERLAAAAERDRLPLAPRSGSPERVITPH